MNYKVITSPYSGQTAIETVLAHRGIAPEQFSFFLHSDNSALLNPHDLNNIEKAARRILTAIARQEKFYVQVDSDCDGYTSAAVLLNYLYRLFPTTVKRNAHYGLHTKKRHGIAVEDIPMGCSLVIAPDSSSNENDIHKQLGLQNIDVVVLDHHQATLDQEDPAIIVNNQMSSRYDNKMLSGVGVVYQTCRVIDEILGQSQADDFLDLVALGLTADMMDLRATETKRLIDIGCHQVKNPFVFHMCQQNAHMMKGKLNPHTISFYIAPFVNAMTRAGTDKEKDLLFRAMLESEANRQIPSTKRGHRGEEELLVVQAVRTTVNVKRRQDNTKTEALKNLTNYIESGACDYGIYIIQLENPIDPNLTGLLANQIMAEYKKPTLLLNKVKSGDGISWSGSGRGFATRVTDDWRAYIEPHATFAEGHPSAFGVAFTPEQLENFKSYARRTFSPDDFQKVHEVDFEFTIEDRFDEIIKDIGRYEELWGQGLTQPLVALKGIPLQKSDVQLLGKGTLKISLGSHRTTCVKFWAQPLYDELMKLFQNEETTVRLTLIGTCDINDFGGLADPQIKLVDYDVDYVDLWSF